jgi:hypothetical protein
MTHLLPIRITFPDHSEGAAGRTRPSLEDETAKGKQKGDARYPARKSACGREDDERRAVTRDKATPIR